MKKELIELIRWLAERSNKVSFHTGGCNIYSREIVHHTLWSDLSGDSEPPYYYSDPGPCSCGWQERCDKMNSILDKVDDGFVGAGI